MLVGVEVGGAEGGEGGRRFLIAFREENLHKLAYFEQVQNHVNA